MTDRRDPLNQMRVELGELDPEDARNRSRLSNTQPAPATNSRRLQSDTRPGPATRGRRPPPAIYVGGLLVLVLVVVVSVWGIVSSARVDSAPSDSDADVVNRSALSSDDAEEGSGQAASAEVERSDGDGDVVDVPDRSPPRDDAPVWAAVGDIGGAWSGPAEGDEDWYDVHVTIGELDAEMSVWIDYPELDCGGILVPDGSTAGGDVLMFVERLTYGHGQCVDNGDVYLWRTSSDQLYWEYVGDDRIWASLTPAETWEVTGAGSERPSPRDDAPSAVALGDISGVWSGPAQGDQDWYGVHLTIAELDGQWAIRIAYPELDCGGRLVPSGSTAGGDVLMFVERLTYGDSQCVDNGGVYLWRTSSNQLYWDYFGTAHIWAVLDQQ